MTVIAWDGISLAGDKQSNFSGIRSRTRKVWRIEHGGRVGLFGCAGATGECQAYAAWAKNPKLPKPTLTDLHILFIDHRRRAWFAAHDLAWSLLTQPCSAIGTGAELATGAMLAGKTAREAVVLANRVNIYCAWASTWCASDAGRLHHGRLAHRTLSNTHEHWRGRQRRAKAERERAHLELLVTGWRWDGRPLVVTMTRLAQATLDTDNLPGAMKSIRDGLADRIGINDNNPLVTWVCAQERQPGYAVRVKIEEGI